MKKYLYLLSTMTILTLSTGTVFADETGNSKDSTVQTETTTQAQEETTTDVAPPANPLEKEEQEDIPTASYEENVANFQKVDIQTVYDFFSENAKGDTTLYIGRPTCIHCRLFSPTLKEFNELIDGKLAYYNTDSEDFDQTAREFLFQTVGIPGTPTTLYLVDGKLQAGWVDGNTTAKELYKNLYKKDYVAPKIEENIIESTSVPTPIEPTELKNKQEERTGSQVVETKVSFHSTDKKDTNAKPTVSKDSFVSSIPQQKGSESKQFLPNTGEKDMLSLRVAGLLTLIFPVSILIKKEYQK